MAAVFFAALPFVPDAAAASASGVCRLEIVDKLKVSAVAPHFSYNGARQNIAKFDSGEGREAVAGAYLKRWQAHPLAPLDARVVSHGRWLIVSKIIGDCLHTVQLDKSAFKASGYVSTRHLDADQAPVVLGKNFPKLYGSNVISDMAHDDPGKKARTLMIANNFSIDANAEFYLRTVGGEGWQAVSDHHVPMQKRSVASRALTFRKGTEQQVIVITESASGSNVVVQWMEKP